MYSFHVLRGHGFLGVGGCVGVGGRFLDVIMEGLEMCYGNVWFC